MLNQYVITYVNKKNKLTGIGSWGKIVFLVSPSHDGLGYRDNKNNIINHN